MKKIVILGSTGSIGKKALKVISNYPKKFEVIGLAANSSFGLMEEQIKKFFPEKVALVNSSAAGELRKRIKSRNIKVLSGEKSVSKIATMAKADMVLPAVIGSAGLIPTLKAIETGKDIAFVNKETLVMAGKLVMEKVKEKGINFIPVDSEMSAIFQCLEGYKKAKKLILTASGGPFWNSPVSKLKNVTPQEALDHPNWDMGNKITIDSATMMNKGFELIEASWLFNKEVSNIDIVIHPESKIHSMVEFVDNSILAQLGVSDMIIPIQYAFTYPKRSQTFTEPLDLTEISSLNFKEVDLEKFPCLKLAYRAAEEGGTVPAVLSSADEVAVEGFLNKRIGFTEIAEVIEKVMDMHQKKETLTIENILLSSEWAKEMTERIIKERR